MIYGTPRPYRLQPAPESPEKIAEARTGRVRLLIVVLTVGATVWISPTRESALVNKCVPLPALNGMAFLIDECPEPHEGEWYATSDNPNTDIVVLEG